MYEGFHTKFLSWSYWKMVDGVYKSDFIFLNIGENKVKPPFKLYCKIDSLLVPNGRSCKMISLMYIDSEN